MLSWLVCFLLVLHEISRRFYTKTMNPGAEGFFRVGFGFGEGFPVKEAMKCKQYQLQNETQKQPDKKKKKKTDSE